MERILNILMGFFLVCVLIFGSCLDMDSWIPWIGAMVSLVCFGLTAVVKERMEE